VNEILEAAQAEYYYDGTRERRPLVWTRYRFWLEFSLAQETFESGKNPDPLEILYAIEHARRLAGDWT
jgi:hypothetical protein